MPKKKIVNRNCSVDQYCLNLSNQYLALVTIFAAIISQEVENDEALGILGGFLVALGEEVELASEIRIACKSKFEESEDNNSSEFELQSVIEDVFDRSISKKSKSSNKQKKVKKIKKIKRKKK